MALAAGEYVSVSPQADTWRADSAKQRHELHTTNSYELRELADKYVGRGLTSTLAHEAAPQLMHHDAISAHAPDELGMTKDACAKQLTAAIASTIAFATSATLPLLTVLWLPQRLMAARVSMISLLFLTVLGALASRAGGAPIARAAFRVTPWGAFALR